MPKLSPAQQKAFCLIAKTAYHGTRDVTDYRKATLRALERAGLIKLDTEMKRRGHYSSLGPFGRDPYWTPKSYVEYRATITDKGQALAVKCASPAR
jgi:hypothetical protein